MTRDDGIALVGSARLQKEVAQGGCRGLLLCGWVQVAGGTNRVLLLSRGRVVGFLLTNLVVEGAVLRSLCHRRVRGGRLFSPMRHCIEHRGGPLL